MQSNIRLWSIFMRIPLMSILLKNHIKASEIHLIPELIIFEENIPLISMRAIDGAIS